MNETCVYQRNGYEDREEYLSCLADDTGIALSTVLALADLLGPSEDFDGLVSAVEDAAEQSSAQCSDEFSNLFPSFGDLKP